MYGVQMRSKAYVKASTKHNTERTVTHVVPNFFFNRMPRLHYRTLFKRPEVPCLGVLLGMRRGFLTSSFTGRRDSFTAHFLSAVATTAQLIACREDLKIALFVEKQMFSSYKPFSRHSLTLRRRKEILPFKDKAQETLKACMPSCKRTRNKFYFVKYYDIIKLQCGFKITSTSSYIN